VIDKLKTRGLWEARASMEPQRTKLGPIVATYDYSDEAGELLYQVTRHFPPKDFRQRRPDGRGGWIWKKHPDQVLYHLPEVLEAAIVFVVEGERDCETLREHGFVATTNAGGAMAPWLPQYTAALAGREVILIPDNDVPGRRRVLTIARALLGKAARLIVLELEDGKDVTEWFSRGHSEVEFIAQVEGEAVSQ
jgi:5S rRNA maturation endonuclease (ribonuclease M5)